MPAPRGQKAATKPGRRASGPTTQLDELPDSVLGLILSLAGDSCGPNISAVSRRWRRVWYSEPAVWRDFVLRPVPPPEAALRLDRLWHGGEEDWQPASEGSLSETEAEAVAEAVAEWWDGASPEQVAAAFAARRRELERTAHLVTRAHLPYAHSLFRDQAERRGGWKLQQVLQTLPAGLEGLTLDTLMDGSVSKQKELVLPAATSVALSRFRGLTALQLRVEVLPKAAAAALARLTGLKQLYLHVTQLGEDVVDSCLALSGLTSLTLCPLRGWLPAQRLLELPQRLPLLEQLQLSEGGGEGQGRENLQLPAPTDLPHLRTYSYGFELCRRRCQVGDVLLSLCSYQEERGAGGGLPMWRRLMDADDSRRGAVQPPSGQPQGRLTLHSASLPSGRTLQQLLQRLLPPCGIGLGALELEECRFTPAQCGDCPLLHGLNELTVKSPHFLPDGHSAAEAQEYFSMFGRRQLPPDGSAADLARKAAVEPVLAALMAQMPRLERLELAAPLPAGCLPACIVQRSGLRFLDLDGSCLPEQLPMGPYLESLETLVLDSQDFERLPRALAAATRCRYLSMNLCYHMDITKRDVDDILVKMAALQELHINNDESWNPYSYPVRLLRYMHERLPGVLIVNMAAELGGSGLPDSDGSEEEWEGDGSGESVDGGSSWHSKGGGGGWDSKGGSGGWGGYYVPSEEEHEDNEEQQQQQQQQPAGGGGSAGAGSSCQPRAKAKPAGKSRPAAKGRTAAGAAKGKGKQPAKGKAAAAAKPRATAKGKGKQGKSKPQQKQPPRKRRGGK